MRLSDWPAGRPSPTVRAATAVAIVMVMSALAVAPAYAAGDPFQALGSKIDAGSRILAPALLVLVLLVVGAMIGLGSENSGKWAGRAFFASIFLILATLGGIAAVDYMKGLTGVQ